MERKVEELERQLDQLQMKVDELVSIIENLSISEEDYNQRGDSEIDGRQENPIVAHPFMVYAMPDDSESNDEETSSGSKYKIYIPGGCIIAKNMQVEYPEGRDGNGWLGDIPQKGSIYGHLRKSEESEKIVLTIDGGSGGETSDTSNSYDMDFLIAEITEEDGIVNQNTIGAIFIMGGEGNYISGKGVEVESKDGTIVETEEQLAIAKGPFKLNAVYVYDEEETQEESV